MDDRDKLRMLLPHWLEHTGEHAAEFRRWAESAGTAGERLRAAARLLEQANKELELALELLGGPLTTHIGGSDGWGTDLPLH